MRQVMKRTGVDSGNLSRYERGLRPPGRSDAVKLADFYGVSLDFVYEHGDGGVD